MCVCVCVFMCKYICVWSGGQMSTYSIDIIFHLICVCVYVCVSAHVHMLAHMSIFICVLDKVSLDCLPRILNSLWCFYIYFSSLF